MRRLAWAAAPVVPLLVLLLVWWFLTVVVAQRPRVYPDPGTVAAALGAIFSGESGLGPTLEHVMATGYRLVVGWSLSMSIGIALGMVAGRSRTAFGFLENVVWVLMATPSIVWAFIFAVAIGVSDWVPILVLTAILGPQCLINIAEGTKSMPRDLHELADAYRVTGLQRLTDVYLPYLVPYIVASARATFATATKIVLIGELIALSSGIGYVVKFWDDQVFFGPVLAWGLLFTTFGILVDGLIFAPIERRTSQWRDDRGGRTTAVVEQA